jgi:hypothetical protein
MGSLKWLTAVALLSLSAGTLWADDPDPETKSEVDEAVIAAQAAAAEASEAVGEVAEEAQEAAAEAAKEAREAYRRAAEVAHKAAEEARAAAEKGYHEAAERAAQARKEAYKHFVNYFETSRESGGRELRIGVTPVPQALDAQLALDGDGLLVDHVTKDGPADKAGVKPFDILIAVDDKKIKAPEVLLDAVKASEGKQLSIKVLRAGKPLTVTVVPEKPSDATLDVQFPSDRIKIEIRELENKLREKLKDAGVDVRMQLIQPGHFVNKSDRLFLTRPADFPDDLKVEIRREGKQPAEIKVTKGDKSWTVKEGDYESLPEELRPHVIGMLGAGAMKFAEFEWKPKPGKPAADDAAGAAFKRDMAKMSTQLDRLREQMDELQDAIKHLKEEASEK